MRFLLHSVTRPLTRSTSATPPRAAVVALTALLALAMAGAGGSVASPASAKSTVETGWVTHIDDGDTLDVRVPGRTINNIRMTGINATELTTYANEPSGWRGKCHGVDAANRMRDLVLGKQVQVVDRDDTSNSGGRPRRSLNVEINGVWTDVGGIMLDEGLALYLPSTTEWQVNQGYLRRAQVAAANHLGIYNTSSCGDGPDQAAPLRVVVQWDAPGNDNVNVNGEFIKVINGGDVAVPLAGWWVRDSAERGTKAYPGYRFPDGTVAAPHSSVVVRVGKGSDTATTKYWGLSAPVFENVTKGPMWLSDGGYLFDPQGDLRAWQMYPCNEFCPVPELKGKIAITRIVADPPGADTAVKEYVTLKNISPAPINLAGYELRADARRWTFRTGSILKPRQAVTVYMGRGKTTTLKQYLGSTRLVLSNGGGTSTVLDPQGTSFLCKAWGRGRC